MTAELDVFLRMAMGRLSNRWLLGLVATGFVVLLALLELTFLRFPTSRESSGSGPKANVPLWFGADGAGWFYLVLGLLYAGLYLWVASQSARSGNTWRTGAVFAFASAAVWLAVSVIANLLAGLVLLRPLAMLAAVGAPMVAGVLTVRTGGQVRDGALAGFWCGVVTAVLIAVITVAVDNAFATTLVHTSWSNDPTCPLPAGPALAGCEIGDDLGLVAVELTLLPMLWAGLGAVAGAAATAMPAISTTGADPGRRPALQAPVIFGGIMAALFLLEMTLKLV